MAPSLLFARRRRMLDTAAALGPRPAFTPPRSPQSNGVREACVKMLRRDHARRSLPPDAAVVPALLPGWFDDHNAVHPHSAPRLLSPREFRRLGA